MGTTLQWSEGLALDLPLMDRTHEEMVNLLAQVGDLPPGEGGAL